MIMIWCQKGTVETPPGFASGGLWGADFTRKRLQALEKRGLSIKHGRLKYVKMGIDTKQQHFLQTFLKPCIQDGIQQPFRTVPYMGTSQNARYGSRPRAHTRCIPPNLYLDPYLPYDTAWSIPLIHTPDPYPFLVEERLMLALMLLFIPIILLLVLLLLLPLLLPLHLPLLLLLPPRPCLRPAAAAAATTNPFPPRSCCYCWSCSCCWCWFTSSVCFWQLYKCN